MDEKQMRQIVKSEIQAYMNAKQFTLSKIPAHTHTGLDAPRVEENDLLPSDIFNGGFVMGNAGSEVFTISKIPRLNTITFYGVATNGAYTNPTTLYNEKATITGEIRIGKVFSLNGNTGTDFYATGESVANYSQACTSAYTDVTTLSKQFVTASATAFAEVFDGTNTVATATVTNATESSIEVTVTVTSSWYIIGFFFIS